MSESQFNTSLSQSQSSILSTNKVLRNTYLLLSMTLLFSAFTASIAMVSNSAPMNPIFTILIYFGLLFFTHKTQNSSMGLVAVFALTGFLGYTLGPILNLYIAGFSNGSELIMMSLGGTGLIFFALSAYALTSQKDFSYLGGFLMAGILVAFLASIATLFFNIPALALAVSAAFILLSSGMILYETSQIIHGGQTNYIIATVTIYVSLYNIFLSLLRLLAAFNGRD